MKSFFESMLWNSRYVVMLAVVSSIVGMLLLFLLSAADMAHLAIDYIEMTFFGKDYPDFHTRAVSHIITAVDDFLLATVLLIFALGLYELFIDKIEIAHGDKSSSNILVINTLDDLKDRLGKVILMILIVAFFKNVLHVTFDDPLNILYMGAGILMVSLASYFSHKSSAKH
ncbi:YqhA family protein [Ghiorsea bivora]|uniref:YqhA family protein n=1 Tax=Ghiorsea bivora TaxID=1485545 RepID=UPI0005704704|nr:YqhA family protein [Ghiorsea bivora]